MQRIDEEVNKIYREAKTYGTAITNEYFKEKLDKIIYPAGKVSKDLFDHFNEYMEAQSIVNTPGTVKKYKTVLNHLKQFQAKKHYSVTFDKIDARFNELIRAFYIIYDSTQRIGIHIHRHCFILPEITEQRFTIRVLNIAHLKVK